MNIKILFIINDNEKKLIKFVNKFHLPFNTIMHGFGTASKGILDFFNLVPTEKNILLSLIPDVREKEILTYLDESLKIKEIGSGIGFTIKLTSSSKYVLDAFKMEGDKMKEKNDYQLIITIVNDGYADKVMNIAKKNGANGGTLLKGRSIGENQSLKFFNMNIEPEKDVLLIVCHNKDKNKIMSEILEREGINKTAQGMCVSLPIDNVIGLN